MKVQIKDGKIVDYEQLDVENVVSMTETSMNIATIWRMDGEIVRQDAYVNMLVGLSMNSEQSEI